MSALAHLMLAALALPAIMACSYLLVLTALSARLPEPAGSSRRLRFDVVVPAHNESATIERTLASLHKLDWPRERFRLLVIADNCDDATATLARAAGAQVLERSDPTRRGKGRALQFAFDHSRAHCRADAVVIVDADSVVSPNLLEAFAARIEAGAGVVQAHYGVLNPAESWRTGLISIAHGAFHSLRSRARERLQLSCGLRGNGWCVTHRVLDETPYGAFSVTEDLEYGIALGLAGQRVYYAGEAHTNADMESSELVARQQRQRWEDGRFNLIRTQSLPLLRAAVLQRSRVCLDLALDLLVLPLSYITLNVVMLVVASLLASLWLADLRLWIWPGLACAMSLLVYVLRGWQLSGRGRGGFMDLLRAPFYVLWKVLSMLRRHNRNEWVPTRRRNP